MKKKVFSLLMVSILLLSSGFAFTETNNDMNIEEFLNKDTLSFDELVKMPGTIVVNEIDMIESLQSNSDSELQELGYSDDKIVEIRNFNILKQLELQSIDGISNIEPYSLGANLAFNVSKDTYYTTGTLSKGTTRAKVIANWSWDKSPYFIYEDAVAFAWGKDLTTNETNSQVKVDYRSNTGLILATRTFYIDDIAPNRGCSFIFPIGSYTGITSGRALVDMYNSQQALKDIEVRAEYGHSTLFLSPSVSWPGGIDIGFSLGMSEVDYDWVTLN